MARLKVLLTVLLLAIITPAGIYAADTESQEQKQEELDVKKIIFDHLGDGYGWEVPFDHHHRMPLPVICYGHDGLHIFSSSHLDHGKTYIDGGTEFRIAGPDSPYKGKLVEIVDGKEHRPFDISITKNVAALWLSVILVAGLMLWLASYLRRNPYKTPRKGLGAIEACVTFIWNGTILPILGPKSRRFAPYLMTVFFFILAMNLLGLAVVFPGGANLTGNIAVTLTLSILTFLVTNLNGNKEYLKEIFWPDVPLFLKFPIPLMQIIEVFSAIIKPAALTVRLFANMLSGHMIVIVLTILIFIFSAVSPWAGGGTTVVSLLFSIFMMMIDVLVCFIQAYVFTILSTIFISLAMPEHEHAHEKDAHHAHAAAVSSSEK
ncbi:MAG: F0F1 ATP synthase subunit A [Muribaculaceae bacterium]|nr:F0F1 ATP synthase subunit A [Muribaculaceae bacterium]